MSTAYVVEVDGATRPALPEVCIVCGRSAGEPLGMLELTEEYGRVEFYFYGLGIEPAQGARLPIRVHDRCARALRNRFLAAMLGVAAVVIAVAAAWTALGLDGMLAFGAGVVAAGPLLYWLFSRPVPMEFWQYGGRYQLVFRDRRTAESVARLNHAEVTESETAWEGVPFGPRKPKPRGRGR